MDDKRFQEIKAKVNTTRDNYHAVRKNDEIYETFDYDIPDLIAEVERLREDERLWSDGSIIVKLADLETENARLRAELEAAMRELAEAHSYIYGDCGATENGGAE